MAHAWKACWVQALGGSNPPSSATTPGSERSRGFVVARGRSKRVTLLDVAKEANCSVSLASIVMRDATGASEETRRRVKAVATRLGYRPDQRARTLRSARLGLIGVTFGGHQPFHAEIVDGLYAAAESGGHELVLSAVVGAVDDRRATETLLRDRCEALVMIAPALGMGRLRVLADEVPIVAVARPLSCPGIDVIRIDDQGGALAWRSTISSASGTEGSCMSTAGAPRRAVNDGPATSGPWRHTAPERRQSWCPGGLEQVDGVQAAKAILAGGALPTAITAFNDRLAFGIIQGLVIAGISVPEQVSVVGFDNARRSDTSLVPLTTIDQNPSLMAQLALERAVGRAADRYLPTQQVLVPRLVDRASTGPAS